MKYFNRFNDDCRKKLQCLIIIHIHLKKGEIFIQTQTQSISGALETRTITQSAFFPLLTNRKILKNTEYLIFVDLSVNYRKESKKLVKKRLEE